MNKSGFTLVELLGILVILSVITVISIVAMNNLLGQTDEIEQDTYTKNLFKAAEAYIAKERETKFLNLDYAGGVAFITVQELYDEAYLPEIPENPKTKERTGQATIIAKIDNLGVLSYSYVDYNVSLSSYVQSGLFLHYDGATTPYQSGGNYFWKDVSGNKKDLTLSGFETKDYLGDRYSLDGENNSFFTSVSPSYTSAITVQTSYVLKKDTQAFLWGFYTGATSSDYRLAAGKSNSIFIKNDADKGVNLLSANYFGNYVNETIVFQPVEKKVTIYINGKFYKEYSTEEVSGGMHTSYFAIGGVEAFATGIICDFLMYDRALNADEIQKNYQISKARFSL